MANKTAKATSVEAEKLLAVLRANQTQFITVGELCDAAGRPKDDDAVVSSICKNKEIVVAGKFSGKSPDGLEVLLRSPVCLLSDLEEFVQSTQLFNFAMAQARLTTGSSNPGLAELPKQLGTSAKIGAKFKEALGPRLLKEKAEAADQQKREKADEKKRKNTEKAEAAEQQKRRLSDHLVKVLQSQKTLGGTSYPTTLNHLVELTQPDALPADVKLAVQLEPFKSKTLISVVGDNDSPLGLGTDVELLAKSPRLMERLLSKVVTDKIQAFGLDKLVKVKALNPVLAPLVQAEWERQLSSKRLPSGLGALRIGGKWNLFRLSDALLGQGATETRVAPAKPHPQPFANGFAADFDAAWNKLNAISRLPGTVSLVDLRPALSQYSRELFDAQLLKLQDEERYALSIVEGRYGLTDEQRSACLIADGRQHLLVSKKSRS